jgi:hypothetical protein
VEKEKEIEVVEQRYTADVVVMQFGFVMQHRSFSFGKEKEIGACICKAAPSFSARRSVRG